MIWHNETKEMAVTNPAASACTMGSNDKPASNLQVKEDTETEAGMETGAGSGTHDFVSCAKQSESGIILIPQPSNSLQDPLVDFPLFSCVVP